MAARMQNPVVHLPKALDAINGLIAATQEGGVPWKTLHLVHLRASQINGCSYCVAMGGAQAAKDTGESMERLLAVAAWRDTPYFSDAERAALALAECVTRLSDRTDPVPDAVWDEARRHYDEKQLAGLLIWIGITNLFNRCNVATKLVAGTPMPWGKAA